MLCIVLSVCIAITGILFLFAIIFFRKERFQVNPSILKLEKTASIRFNELELITASPNRTGIGRIILFNRNNTIPLMLSFFNSELTISHFENFQPVTDKVIQGIPPFEKLTISKEYNRLYISIGDHVRISIDSRIPLNITKIRIFNSFGSFFLDDTKLTFK